MESARRSPEPIIRMVAHSRHHTRLVADLHARAIAAGGASRSVLLELDAPRQHLRPTSGTGFEQVPPDPWIELPDSVALAYELFASGNPRQVAPLATVLPDLAFRLESPAAILAPVVSEGHALGLLVLAVSRVVPALEWMDQVAACADGFALALSRMRLEQELARQHEVDAFVLDLARTGAGDSSDDQVERFCGKLARLFGADRVALWRHDRVARRVAVVAASDGSHRRRAASSPTSDSDALLVKALRGTAVELMPAAVTGGRAPVTNAAVPLRGQRRALGVLMVQGLRLAPGDDQRTIECLTRLGHGVSRAIEGRQLLDDVLGARRELEDTFDSMRDVVVVCDRHLRFVRVNRAGTDRLARPRETIVGQRIAEFVGPQLGAWLEALPLGTVEPWQPCSIELEDPGLGGTFRVTVTPLPDAGRALAGLVIVARDVTDERRLESERTALRERLARSEALTHLVAGIAHELNNPLQGVLGHLELMRHGTRVPAHLEPHIRQVYREAERAARIVRNLLLLAGEGQLRLRIVSSNRALTRALELRSSICRRDGIEVHRHLAAGLPQIRGDAVLLQQAFLNILINAEQALGGRDGGRIDVRSYAQHDRVVVEIRDNGPGLAPDVAPRVFDPFFTTRESGSGLGLALTLRIVRELGGDAVAANHPDGGAVFTVSLPARTVVK